MGINRASKNRFKSSVHLNFKQNQSKTKIQFKMYGYYGGYYGLGYGYGLGYASSYYGGYGCGRYYWQIHSNLHHKNAMLNIHISN